MNTFFQSISALPPPFNMVVYIVLIGATAGVLGTLSKEVFKYLRHRNEVDLKREMLDRGMDAHEIEQVMRARVDDGATRPRVP